MPFLTECATIQEQTFELHPLRSMYWREQETLLLADLHLGKARHFRREGIPVPQLAGEVNFEKLIFLLLEYKPRRVIFLGDLFHSAYNRDWEELVQLLATFKDIPFELVLGNHDILRRDRYEKSGLILHPEQLFIGPLLLTHEPLTSIPDGQYNLAGHIHPCVTLRGKGRQRLRLPCFHFGAQKGLIPAFGTFTGMAEIPVKAEEQVFVISEDQVIQVF